MRKTFVYMLLCAMMIGNLPITAAAAEINDKIEPEKVINDGNPMVSKEEAIPDEEVEDENTEENTENITEENSDESTDPVETPVVDPEGSENTEDNSQAPTPDVPSTPEFTEAVVEEKENPAQPITEAPKQEPQISIEQSSPAQTTATASNYIGPVTKLQSTELFIAMIGEQARALGQKYDLYASVMIAQAILESDSGNSSLSRPPLNNLFGIKGTYQGQSIVLPTQEDNGEGQLSTIQDVFRQYPTLYESLEDYAKLLKQGVSQNSQIYAGTWKSNASTYREATKALTGKYATDIYYDQKLNQLIETYQLTRFDERLSDDEAAVAATLTVNATKYLGVPYVWGGTQPTGFDCSGLVQYVYREAMGVELLRTTSEQETQGRPVALNELKTGDLLFWGSVGQSTHVAMYVTNGYFIHAPQANDVVKMTHITDFQPDFARRIAE